MILDDPERDDRYMVDDMVIYSHGRLLLTRGSSLKEKLLHAAYEDLFSMHFDAYLALARSSFGRAFSKTYFSIWRDAEPG